MRRVKVFFILLVVCLLQWQTAWAGTVTVQGSGATERQALHAALRTAVEEETGVLVDSKTYVDNYRVISDKIYAHAEGYVTSYEVLESIQQAGVWQVTLTANVASEFLRTDLLSKLQKQALVSTNLQDPRLGVMIINGNGTAERVVENKIIAGLQENGFTRVVDLQQADQATQQRLGTAIKNGEENLAALLRADASIDYLVTGTLNWINKTGQSWQSSKVAEVVLEARLFNVSTGEIAFADSFRHRVLGQSAQARSLALQKVTREMTAALAQAALRKAATTEQHLRLLVTAGTGDSLTGLVTRLRELPGVQEVYARNLVEGRWQFDVNFDGTAADFAEVLEQHGIAVQEMNTEFIKI